MSEYFLSISFSLSGTLAIEMTLAYLLGLRGRNLETVFMVNCLTNPILVTFMFWGLRVPGLRDWVDPIVVILEDVVVFVEGAIYSRRLKNVRRDPYVLSLILNATSYGAGLVVNVLLR